VIKSVVLNAVSSAVESSSPRAGQTRAETIDQGSSSHPPPPTQTPASTLATAAREAAYWRDKFNHEVEKARTGRFGLPGQAEGASSTREVEVSQTSTVVHMSPDAEAQTQAAQGLSSNVAAASHHAYASHPPHPVGDGQPANGQPFHGGQPPYVGAPRNQYGGGYPLPAASLAQDGGRGLPSDFLPHSASRQAAEVAVQTDSSVALDADRVAQLERELAQTHDDYRLRMQRMKMLLDCFLEAQQERIWPPGGTGGIRPTPDVLQMFEELRALHVAVGKTAEWGSDSKLPWSPISAPTSAVFATREAYSLSGPLPWTEVDVGLQRTPRTIGNATPDSGGLRSPMGSWGTPRSRTSERIRRRPMSPGPAAEPPGWQHAVERMRRGADEREKLRVWADDVRSPDAHRVPQLAALPTTDRSPRTADSQAPLAFVDVDHAGEKLGCIELRREDTPERVALDFATSVGRSRDPSFLQELLDVLHQIKRDLRTTGSRQRSDGRSSREPMRFS